ncbi:MAG: hypothetical protein GY749_02080, partial [Desulfobacteraceae bacterium]|nr:hypothetical protein [Desulfobacteraceae bacterium]
MFCCCKQYGVCFIKGYESKIKQFLVPTLRVGMQANNSRSHALRGNAGKQLLVPTLCVGMQANNSSFPRSAWECRQTTPRS